MREFVFAEANVNWALPFRLVKEDVRRVGRIAHCIFFQETKNVDLHRILSDKHWIILQNRSSIGHRNSAIALRRSHVHLISHNCAYEGRGVKGHPMAARYAVHAAFRIIGGPFINGYAVHMPPKRFPRWLYRRFARVIIHFAGANVNKVLGGDWNRPVERDSGGIRYFLRLKAYDGGRGHNICGFLMAKRLRVCRQWRMKTHSDHPVIFASIAY